MTVEENKFVIFFLGGEISNLLKVDILNADYIIAVDKGLIYCAENQLKPDIIVGDMDSLSHSLLTSFSQSNPHVRVEVHPREKDYTDFELALKFVPPDVNILVVYCGLGERLDHTLANIDIISSFASSNNMLAIFRGAREDIYILTDKCPDMTLEGEKDDVISLIPWSLEVLGVTIDNVKYPLEKRILLKAETLGISNVMLNCKTRISIESGTLLVLHNRNGR